MNRRGFLTKMLGATGAASAFALVPATVEEAKVVDAGEFDFTSVPRGGFFIQQIRWNIEPRQIEVTHLDQYSLSQFIDLPDQMSLDISLRSAGDPAKLMELGRFLQKRRGQVL